MLNGLVVPLASRVLKLCFFSYTAVSAVKGLTPGQGGEKPHTQMGAGVESLSKLSPNGSPWIPTGTANFASPKLLKQKHGGSSSGPLSEGLAGYTGWVLARAFTVLHPPGERGDLLPTPRKHWVERPGSGLRVSPFLTSSLIHQQVL